MSSSFVPSNQSKALRWLRRNLFRGPVDSVVTIVVGAISLYLLYRLGRYIFVTGRWDIVRVNLRLLMVGRFPTIHLPRIAVTLVVLGGVGGLVAGMIASRQTAAGTSPYAGMSPARRALDLLERFWIIIAATLLLLALTSTTGPTIAVVAAVAAGIVGRVIGQLLPKIVHPFIVIGALLAPFALVAYLVDATGWDEWGGMMLNVYLAIVSIILCFPLGVAAALGRRSKLPVISAISTGYIELFRGAPLYVLLLMANVALGFFVPADLAPGDVVRAIVVFTLFTGAYMAEIVRGGLQSLPKGQEEAGKALGLSPIRITFRIILPQALRNVIPASVGQLISLFKDTTLAGIAMGLFDALTVAYAIPQQDDFRGQGLIIETLAFVALLFWVGSYTMSRESQRLEARLGVGTR